MLESVWGCGVAGVAEALARTTERGDFHKNDLKEQQWNPAAALVSLFWGTYVHSASMACI